jgi:O-antigen/teichoic acid export membrane protein
MSRIKKTFLNARINLIFYTLTLVLSFFSRKFFIETLGTTFLGLTGTISNLLGFLNLTELGLGTAITYLLFQPLANNNRKEINNILSILRYYYKKIGIYLFLGGIVLSAFFPIIFKNSSISLLIVYGTFFTFLFISFINYYFNYLQLLLEADQKNYVRTTYEGSLNIVKVILQIIVLVFVTDKVLFYLFIELLFCIAKIVLINKVIHKEYSWIKLSHDFKSSVILNKDIKTKTKQIFSHQVAGYILSQTDQLLIFSFTSLSMVTYYTNYTLLLGRIISVIDQFLNSSHASIGNLIASKNYDQIKNIFNELMVLRYWIGGTIIFVAYNFVPSIIEIWLGKKFLLDNNIFTLMLINNYIMITRRPIDSFLNTSGIYRDTWAPWTEATINLLISVIAGYYYGIAGILFGTLISMIVIVVLWKPYLLYSEGFNVSVKKHWINVSIYIVSYGFCFITTSYFIHLIKFDFLQNKYLNLFTNILLYALSFSILYYAVLFLLQKSMRSLTNRLLSFFIQKNKSI